MNIKQLALPLILLLLVSVASAQTSATRPAGTAAPAATGPVPNLKVGIVNIPAFRENIAELRQIYEKLQAEFGQRANELEAMQTKLENQQKMLTEKGPTLTQPQLKKLSDDFEAGKIELQRKSEDYQAQARKREEEATRATYDKVSKFLDQYAQKRGLTIILEASVGLSNNIIVYAAPNVDITQDFINEYNKANPVAAAAVPKKP